MFRKYLKVIALCVGLFFGVLSFSNVYAANVLTQKNESGVFTTNGESTSDSVSFYVTYDSRGDIYNFVSTDSWTTQITDLNNATTNNYRNRQVTYWSIGSLYHISVTVRNRTNFMAVADLNNFQILFSGYPFQDFPEVVVVQNPVNVDVYNVDLNDSSNNLYFNFRSVEPLVLEPNQQIDIEFDFVLTTNNYNLSSAAQSPAQPNLSSPSGPNLVTYGSFTQSPSYFTLYTMESYSNNFEGFWPYLLRMLRAIVYGENGAYDEVEDSSSDVSDSSSSVSSEIEVIHQQEAEWYEDNSESLESVGLSNFSFSPTNAAGLAQVTSLFSRLWVSVGDWSFVYTFTLMLSLATFILRHRPNTHSKNSSPRGQKSP